ncbi:MAG: hypothetical protein WC222_00810 [Parachlamydiales bacterium]
MHQLIKILIWLDIGIAAVATPFILSCMICPTIVVIPIVVTISPIKIAVRSIEIAVRSIEITTVRTIETAAASFKAI